jgi:hypothetical protein
MWQGAGRLPNAVQVADRWHLMENASHAFLDAVRRSMRQIRCAIGAMTIKPELLTAAEKLQYEGYLHREETNAAILAFSKDGVAIKEIVRRTGHSRGTVRRVLRGERSDVFRTRETSLETYLPWLDLQWAAGLRLTWRLNHLQLDFKAEFFNRISLSGATGMASTSRTWPIRLAVIRLSSGASDPLPPNLQIGTVRRQPQESRVSPPG